LIKQTLVLQVTDYRSSHILIHNPKDVEFDSRLHQVLSLINSNRGVIFTITNGDNFVFPVLRCFVWVTELSDGWDG
jgi:hypothetical protein